MGVVVPQKAKALGQIKAAAQAAASVPALRDQVALLADEVQKLKDQLVSGSEIQDD